MSVTAQPLEIPGAMRRYQRSTIRQTWSMTNDFGLAAGVLYEAVATDASRMPYKPVFFAIHRFLFKSWQEGVAVA